MVENLLEMQWETETADNVESNWNQAGGQFITDSELMQFCIH